MQPDVNSRSQLFKSLKVYLNDKNRQQPIVGLKSIIECVKMGVQHEEPLYLCEVCVSQLRRADIRNHILGTHHRFNFIKTRYPHLVAKWEEKYELSEKAWQLMDEAKKLESKEGPGDVQVIEVEDDVYHRMKIQDASDVGAFIKSLRDYKTGVQSYPGTISSLHYPIMSERIVLSPNRNLQTCIQPGDISAHTDESSKSRPTSINADMSLESTLTAEMDTHRSSHSSSVLPVDVPSFLEDYAGTPPLHGLSRVVECRGQDNSVCFYLCHCCRIRANKDIATHLSSSSHLLNYLMEIYPEQLNVDLKANSQYLQLMIRRVEQEEGRGVLKVVTVPESINDLLTGRSYHWCLKMLCEGLTRSYKHKKTSSFKGLRENVSEAQDMPRQYPAKQLQRTKERTKKRKRSKGKEDTVFKVSLPLTEGAVLLKRTDFSTDSLPLLSETPPAYDRDRSPSSDLQEVDCEPKSFDSDRGPYYGERADADHDPTDQENSLVSRIVDIETCGPKDPYLNEYGDLSGSNNHEMYEERRHRSSQNFSRGTTSQDLYQKWPNEDNYNQAQDWRIMPSVPNNQSWSGLDSSYRHGDVSNEQEFNWSSRTEVETAAIWPRRDERHGSMNTNVDPNYYNQPNHNPHMPEDNMANSAWGHGNMSKKPFLDSGTQKMQPYDGNVPVVSSGGHFQTNRGDLQAYTQFSVDPVHSAPQDNWIQLVSYQDRPVDHGVMHSSNNNKMNQQHSHSYSSSFTTQTYNCCYPRESHGYGGPQYYHGGGPNLPGFTNTAGAGKPPCFFQHT